MWRKSINTLYIIDEFENGEFTGNRSFMLLSRLVHANMSPRMDNYPHSGLLVSNGCPTLIWKTLHLKTQNLNEIMLLKLLKL